MTDEKKRSGDSRYTKKLSSAFLNSILIPRPQSVNNDEKLSSVQRAGLHPLFHPNILLDIGEYMDIMPYKQDQKVFTYRIKKMNGQYSSFIIVDNRIVIITNDGYITEYDANDFTYIDTYHILNENFIGDLQKDNVGNIYINSCNKGYFKFSRGEDGKYKKQYNIEIYNNIRIFSEDKCYYFQGIIDDKLVLFDMINQEKKIIKLDIQMDDNVYDFYNKRIIFTNNQNLYYYYIEENKFELALKNIQLSISNLLKVTNNGDYLYIKLYQYNTVTFTIINLNNYEIINFKTPLCNRFDITPQNIIVANNHNNSLLFAFIPENEVAQSANMSMRKRRKRSRSR